MWCLCAQAVCPVGFGDTNSLSPQSNLQSIVTTTFLEYKELNPRVIYCWTTFPNFLKFWDVLLLNCWGWARIRNFPAGITGMHHHVWLVSSILQIRQLKHCGVNLVISCGPDSWEVTVEGLRPQQAWLLSLHHSKKKSSQAVVQVLGPPLCHTSLLVLQTQW